MKHILLAGMFLVGLYPLTVHAQSNLQKLTVLTSSNEKIEGTGKELLKNKGSILLVTPSGEKKTLTPADLLSFNLNGVEYVSYSNDFYKVLTTGTIASLYQRVTDNSGKIVYNGAEATVLTTMEGKNGDYFLKIKKEENWLRIGKKNFETSLVSAASNCPVLLEELKSKPFDFSNLIQSVERLNACK